MILKQQSELIEFACGNSTFKFLPTGDIYEFINRYYMINGFQGNTVNGSANNIYLRVYDNNKVVASKALLGIQSESKIHKGKNKLIYTGNALGINYKVTFAVGTDGIWFFKVDLEKTNKTVDVIYAQDIGVADKGGILTNELYMCQYLDNKILSGDNGYVVCSRQNQSQGGNFPYLQQGALNAKIVGYSTDATQFFGLQYKFTHIPAALSKNLENRNYQFELSYTALQTEKIDLSKEDKSLSFYGIFKSNHELAVTELEFQDEIKKAYKDINWENDNHYLSECTMPSVADIFGEPYSSSKITKEEIDDIFKEKKLEEYDDDGNLLSFFTNDYQHVVLQEKEEKTERPHGHIITTLLNDTNISSGLITSTNYMYGIFNGQVVAGNTSFHKFISTPRGLLNILKNTGQRIYVKIDGVYRILTMPAMYEMGINYSKWYYKIKNDMLIVTTYTVADASDIVLKIESKQSKKYSFIVTNQLVMGECEFQQDIDFEQDGLFLTFKPLKKNWESSPYSDLQYNIVLKDSKAEVSDDRIFYVDNKTRNGTLLTIKSNEVDNFELIIQGRVEKKSDDKNNINYDFDIEKQKYINAYKKLNCGFNLSIQSSLQSELDRLNAVSMWYTHNAMVHFAVPHGLEQPGGAAWGTRDVCQGPIEYFLATRHYTLAKNILLNIFSHQSYQTKEWPQWFMFDKYPVQCDSCHGDVVFWPLKCISDYIKITGDKEILNELVIYQDTKNKESVLDHIRIAIDSIKDRFLHNTALISYAGGDWDDTLQPAHKELSNYLVSAWTMALAYQTIHGLGNIISNVHKKLSDELISMANDIKESFDKYLIKDGVIAGFAYCENMNEIKYMLHPNDNQTGIQYRLLPLTRSIISEMADKSQSEINVQLINEHLKCPDGIRLMNKPARYEGGVCRFFQRAEQAANVGREISLQYVHAHIRYIEAMAKIGNSKEAWDGLLQINPVDIKKSVSNARLRQSNAYFSSSEGAFDTRYEYQNYFDMLRNGSVEVKGGWRIYSSGPGIYMNQLISNVLGIRFTQEAIIIDPILPEKLNGLSFNFNCFGDETKFVYHINKNAKYVQKVMINNNNVDFEYTENPYRSGGVIIHNDKLRPLLKDTNVIDIYM